jgi:hypothetical protein
MESWRLDGGAVDGCVAVEVIPDFQHEDPLLRAERLGGGCGAGRSFAGCLAEYLSPLTLHFDVEASDKQLTRQLVSLALSS